MNDEERKARKVINNRRWRLKKMASDPEWIVRYRLYQRDWHRIWRKKTSLDRKVKHRQEKLLREGKCIFCEMLIASEYHKQFPCESSIYAKKCETGQIPLLSS